MKLAIFDFDGTLFPQDTPPFLLSQWKRLKYSRFTYYKTFISCIPLFIKYKLNIITKLSKQEMKILAFKKFNHIFKGMNEQQISDYFSVCCKEIKGLLNESVAGEIKKAQTEGFHTVLLSGAHYYLLQDIGEFLNFDTVIGTKMCFENNLFDPNKDTTEVVVGDMKLKKIYEHFGKDSVDWESSRSYADSYSDLDILQAVGHPVAVNPDARLKAIAAEKGWRIMS